MIGNCACGAVSVTVARKPHYINFCNCSLCRKMGGAWGYYRADEVSVTGALTQFQREDIDPVCLITEFCPGCGAVVRWMPLPEHDDGRVGINMRLFDPAELAGIESRFPNGIDWNDNDDRPPPRHEPLPYGSGLAF